MKQITTLLLLLFTLQLSSQDTNAPVLTSFSVTPQIVDITDGPGQITIIIGATDDLSGIDYIKPFMDLPNDDFSNGNASKISGTNLDGIWQKTFTIPQYTLTGTGVITQLQIVDEVNNKLILFFDDLVSLGYDPDFEIVSSSESDIDPPALTSFSISPQIVDITNGSGQITVTIGATDNLSGIDYIKTFMDLPSGGFGNGNASKISGTYLDGIWQKNFTIPQFTQTGTGVISQIQLVDEVNNKLILFFDDLVALGYDLDFEIIDFNESDVTAPELTSFSISPQIVDITDGPGQITVTIGATEDLSGIDYIKPFMDLPNGDFSNGNASQISGTNLNGVWEKNFTIPQFTVPGTGVISQLKLVDEVDNQLVLFFDDLVSLGYDPDFEIIDNNILPVIWSQPLRIVNANRLTWAVSQQVNTSHFEIEHSQDGRQFKSIEVIKGEGNIYTAIEYEYIHQNQSSGTNYYRIKQVDFDGQYDYSNVVSVVLKDARVRVYPNPATDKIFINSIDEGKVVIYNNLGKYVKEYRLNEGQTEVDLSELVNGIYYFKFEGGHVEQVVKNL